MCVKVSCVSKASDGTISHIGGSAENGTQVWGLTRDEAIARIESGDWSFFVARPAPDIVPILVRMIGNKKVLTTAPDDTKTNNLIQLPECSPSLSSTDPQFPLSIPGPRQPVIKEVEDHLGHRVLPDAQGRYQITGWTQSTPLRVLRVTCESPFPALLEVYVDKDPTQSGYVEATHKLARPLSLPERWDLEAQGKGWWEWTIQMLGPEYPKRFTPSIVHVQLPPAAVTGTGVTIYIRSASFNVYCPGPSVPLTIVAVKPQMPYQPPGVIYGRTTTSPSVPARQYKEGAFVAVSPTTANVGASVSKGTSKLEIKSSQEVGSGGWSQFAVYSQTSPTVKSLAMPVGFEVMGTGTPGGGATFSPSGAMGIVLAIKQPNIIGHSGDVLFRFAKLGASAAYSLDTPGFIATANAQVLPRILLDPAEQVALVVSANRFGVPQEPGLAALLDLGHGASPLREITFDGKMISAVVTKRSDGKFEAAITTSTGTTTVVLPTT